MGRRRVPWVAALHPAGVDAPCPQPGAIRRPAVAPDPARRPPRSPSGPRSPLPAGRFLPAGRTPGPPPDRFRPAGRVPGGPPRRFPRLPAEPPRVAAPAALGRVRPSAAGGCWPGQGLPSCAGTTNGAGRRGGDGGAAGAGPWSPWCWPPCWLPEVGRPVRPGRPSCGRAGRPSRPWSRCPARRRRCRRSPLGRPGRIIPLPLRQGRRPPRPAPARACRHRGGARYRPHRP